MTRLFLHIGQPKTATTSIQTSLATNRGSMIRRGWLYADTARQYAAHHLLGNFFRAEPLQWIAVVDPDETRAALQREIEATGCENVILSTESLYYAEQPEACAEYFRDFDTYVVVFLRRQDEWLESAYQENLKNGETTLDPANYMPIQAGALDYAANVRRWGDAFGRDKVIIHVFERTEVREDVSAIFLRAIGAPEGMLANPQMPMNDRLNRDCLAFLMNFRAGLRTDLHHQLIKDLLALYSQAHPDPASLRYFYTPAQRRALLESCAAGNAEVARNYMGRSDGLLFRAPLPAEDEPWTHYPGLDTKTAVHIAEHVMRAMYQMIQNARARQG